MPTLSRPLGVLTLALLARPGLAQPTGMLIVLDKADNDARFIDMPSGALRATCAAGRGPHEAAVSPNRLFGVAANYEDPTASTLTVLNLGCLTDPFPTIDLGESKAPHGLAFVPGSGLLAATCEQSGQLVLVDVAKGEVVARIATGAKQSHMVAVTPDGSRAFTGNIADGTVSAIDLRERKLLKIIPTGRGSEGIDVTPDGKEVWVCNRAADTLSVIDADSLAVIDTVPCKGFPIPCKATTDGARILVSCATAGEVAVLDTPSRKEIARIKVLDRAASSDLGPIGILSTPDGKSAFVANSSRNEVVVLDLASLAVTQRVETGNVPDGLACVPGVPAQTPALSPAAR
ncbi:MAG: hypothetical protein IPJ41_10130 [Phycisphaerales bacterium]|nr:hypothetical protein [Phycisphaerales bacterium]